MTALAVEDLVCGYGHVEALHGVGLRVDAGEAVAVVGANGAGKSTLLRAVVGLVAARRGRVVVAGQDVTAWPVERRVRAGVALVPEGRRVFTGLTVEDNLLLGTYARRGTRAGLRSRLGPVLALFPALARRLARPAGTLSGGQQQMLAIGRALVAAPRLLLLDEPSLGLAPRAVTEVVGALAALAGGAAGPPTTVVLVEQNAHAAFTVAGRGYLLDRGAVAVAGPTDRLRRDPGVQAAYLGAPPTR